ncbi:MAG: hypothetical protein AAGF11_16835 [Myxococcota bacterium]
MTLSRTYCIIAAVNIAIITLLHTFLHETITTNSNFTVIRAFVRAITIAVIAFLVQGPDNAITTPDVLTLRRTYNISATVELTFVAFFHAFPHEAITTSGKPAVIETLIRIISITIIAFFHAFPHEPISTS